MPGPSGRDQWAAAYEAAARRGQVQDRDFTTLSGLELEPVYGPPDGLLDPRLDEIGWPGGFPFTRGLYPTGYRGRGWTIRQFAGFGSAEQTNARYKMILNAGGGGLSVAFDMPTLMGRDSDEPQSLGEVGHCGVAIDSAADMDLLFAGIDLGTVTTSMTISGPAVPIFCMYVVAAERQGVDTTTLNGTLQTDIFKEYIAQKEWIFAPEPHLRLIGDLMAYCIEHVPAYKPLSVSGDHIREAGSTAAQELAFTLADGFGYVELGLSRGLDIEKFAPGLSFFFDAHVDFFEETGVMNVADPLGGSWYVEALTDELERQAEEVFTRIRDMGTDGTMTSGILRGIEDGWFTGEIAEAAFVYQRALEKGDKKVVGVNTLAGSVDAHDTLDILRVSHQVEIDQKSELAARRKTRDDDAARAAVQRMVEVGRTEQNMVPAMLDAVRAEATLGEICDALRAEWGTYTEPARF